MDTNTKSTFSIKSYSHGNTFFDKYKDKIYKKALEEMIRILKPGGQGMFSVWSVENQEKEKIKRDFKDGDNYVTWCRRKDQKIFKRYYYIYSEKMIRQFLNKFKTKINMERLYNERGNWVVIFTKI